jgi:KaiC/GvpD/RAD55 family RecA-like ATPase
MIKEELVSRSPVRVFEKSIHGGLKTGEIGVVAAQSGVGKTAVLVQIALDKLLQNKKVIHVSFSQHTDYVLTWYTDIFNEIIKKKNLEKAQEIKAELIKNRVLMNFNQDGVTSEMILRSIKAMINEGGFKADSLIIDGFDFSRTSRERLSQVKDFAKELNLEIWYSCNVSAGGASSGTGLYDKRKIPVIFGDFAGLFDVIIVLEPKQDHIELSVSRDRETYNPDAMALKLDPKTLLIQ